MHEAQLLTSSGDYGQGEDELLELVAAAPVLLCAVDFDGAVLELAPYWQRFLGRPLAEIRGTRFQDLVHLHDGGEIDAWIRGLAASGTPRHFDCRLRRHDDIYRHVRWTARVEPQAERIVLAGHDVTEDRREQEILRKEHRLWSSLVESSPDIIMMLDRNANILFLNRPIGTGSVNEMIGTSLYAHVPDSFHPALALSLQRVLRSCRHDRCSFEQHMPGGAPAVLELRIHPIVQDGEVSAMTVNVTDITESRRALEALGRSESRLRAFLSALDDLALEITRDGIVLNVWTRDPEELLLPREIFPGSLLHEIFPAEVATDLAAAIQELQAHPRLQSVVEYSLESDGERRMFLARLSLINKGDDNVPASVACLVQETTGIHRAAKERERLIAQLEEHAAELEGFAHTAAHDLKNPLTTIRNFVGRIHFDVEAGRFEHVPEDLERIRHATTQMTRLLENIWTLSRTGRFQEDHDVDIPLLEVVQTAVDLVSQPVGRRPVHVKIAADLPTLRANPLLLNQIFQHLIDNAIKFMGDQGRPEIEVSSRRDGEGHSMLWVRDNGIGIDPHYHDKIFGLFDQLDPNTNGTGIGLALVKRIVEIYGGTIWVESSGVAGEGSSFFFLLPRTDKTCTQGR